MKKIDFNDPVFASAQKIFDFFKVETDCLDADNNLTVCPRYVVALGDDPVTVFYAATIMKKALAQYGRYPELLCCGGKNMISRYLNQTKEGIIPQGQKLAQIAWQLNGDFPVKALTNANNAKGIVEEIISHVHGDPSAIIFCPTQRMSKLWERLVYNANTSLPESKFLNAHWYVPGEKFKDIFALYNGGAIAGGILMLSEAALIYHTLDITGKVCPEVCYNGGIPKHIIHAGISLRDAYPLFITDLIWSAPKQYLRLLLKFKLSRAVIDLALQEKINWWRSLI